ncbi:MULTISPECIES: flagellar motor switch protein FliN [Marinobacter]|uniref:Flagellar motor switch protein FliN n=1 Tax=Marinobacter xiaoshiensis TaxID=3073652 RepID=A0ABU2HEV5_9GAMM|nr:MULTISPECIES: flagellar motor switch protein FliN [unclassified Marinobacter]MBK1872099.1 flagellar motor switch protein FliN [Marinobacter sp. 1-3A]MBK1885523.1 flagellar motor switch protein FliN [Marinobacter sp. DY40_1A1]MDS1309567.1 flagellar motor switch protein FliN [Marinobacter sp. F60267]
MADDKKEGQELSEDEKLAAEWEAAMEESGDEGSEESTEDEWAQAMEEAGETGAGKAADSSVRAAPMEEFDESSMATKGSATPPDLDVILDIPVSISMEVGNTQIPIRNLLQLNQGSVIELDRLAGEPLDVLVNGTLIAHGEVVMVNEKFGIRLTDVISPGERIKRLQK